METLRVLCVVMNLSHETVEVDVVCVIDDDRLKIIPRFLHPMNGIIQISAVDLVVDDGSSPATILVTDESDCWLLPRSRDLHPVGSVDGIHYLLQRL